MAAGATSVTVQVLPVGMSLTVAGLPGATADSEDVSETDFGINGGAGVTLRLAGLEAFAEARVANVYTKRERFGNLKTVQYVPVTFGVLF